MLKDTTMVIGDKKRKVYTSSKGNYVKIKGKRVYVTLELSNEKEVLENINESDVKDTMEESITTNSIKNVVTDTTLSASYKESHYSGVINAIDNPVAKLLLFGQMGFSEEAEKYWVGDQSNVRIEHDAKLNNSFIRKNEEDGWMYPDFVMSNNMYVCNITEVEGHEDLDTIRRACRLLPRSMKKVDDVSDTYDFIAVFSNMSRTVDGEVLECNGEQCLSCACCNSYSREYLVRLKITTGVGLTFSGKKPTCWNFEGEITGTGIRIKGNYYSNNKFKDSLVKYKE